MLSTSPFVYYCVILFQNKQYYLVTQLFQKGEKNLKMTTFLDDFNFEKQPRTYVKMDTPYRIAYVPAFSKPMNYTPSLTYALPPLEMLHLSQDSDTETVETVSPANNLCFEYRIVGLTWLTAPITNSCHMDSFLSAFVRQVRQTHGKFLNKITYADDVGTALIRIGEHSLKSKNNIDSTYIRMLWIEAVTKSHPQLPISSGGLEQFSVFQHLDHHSGFVLEQKCHCGTQYMFESTVRSACLHDIRGILTNSITGNSSLLICADCKMRREFVKLTPTPSNWLITVLYSGRTNPDFDEIEQVLTLNNNIYKLGYLGFTLPAFAGQYGHFLSLQRIRGHWYKYGETDKPHFSLYPNDIRFVQKDPCYLETLVYFRV